MKNRNKSRPILVGITGPSGAGKSTLATSLKSRSRSFEHVRLDDYFKNPKNFPMKGKFVNWEHPKNLKFSLLLKHIKKLRSGNKVQTYSFPIIQGLPKKSKILQPKKFILVEGFLLFYNQRLRDCLDIKIYLDLPVERMIDRRAKRFRNRNLYEYDIRVAIPEFLRHGLKQRKYADYCIDARKNKSSIKREILNILNNL